MFVHRQQQSRALQILNMALSSSANNTDITSPSGSVKDDESKFLRFFKKTIIQIDYLL